MLLLANVLDQAGSNWILRNPHSTTTKKQVTRFSCHNIIFFSLLISFTLSLPPRPVNSLFVDFCFILHQIILQQQQAGKNMYFIISFLTIAFLQLKFNNLLNHGLYCSPSYHNGKSACLLN
jgi:hypothetical protein